MKSLALCFLITLTGCGTTADWSAAAGAMAGELNRQAQTGTGVFTQPQVPVQRVNPYTCTSKAGYRPGTVVTECR